RSIGVSNFAPSQIERLEKETGVMPVLNQIELHPYNQRVGECAFHAEFDIQTECYSPLGRGRNLDDPVLVSIGQKHGKSPAQVVLRWHIERQRVAVARSSKGGRMRENVDLDGFTLDEEDHARIEGLDRGVAGQLGTPPDFSP